MHRFAVAFAAVALTGLATGTALAAPSGTMGPKDAKTPQGAMASDAAFLQHDRPVRLAAYFGHPLMIWEVATWCGSCKAGLKAFAHHQALIDKSGATIIVLRDYKNGGYPGITIQKFAAEVAPSLLKDPHFIFGDATKALTSAYNPHHYVDVYQLIDAKRQIVVNSSAPSVTFGRIERFIAPRAQ